MKLNDKDKELIQLATELVKSNSDIYSNISMHVGCVIKAKSGKIYKGVNIKTSHSICAEQVAYGQALANGEREFDTIVAVKMNSDGTTRVVSPCGVCRYMFDKMGLDMCVIVEDIRNGKVVKVKVEDLLPYPYKQNDLYYKGVKRGKF
ncbi:MAG: cytidine deaminase [Clostridia bacterium]